MHLQQGATLCRLGPKRRREKSPLAVETILAFSEREKCMEPAVLLLYKDKDEPGTDKRHPVTSFVSISEKSGTPQPAARASGSKQLGSYSTSSTVHACLAAEVR